MICLQSFGSAVDHRHYFSGTAAERGKEALKNTKNHPLDLLQNDIFEV